MKLELMTIATLGLATIFSACFHGDHQNESHTYEEAIDETEYEAEISPEENPEPKGEVEPENEVEPKEELYIM